MVLSQRRYEGGNEQRLGGGLILTSVVAGLCWIPWAAAQAGNRHRAGGILMKDFKYFLHNGKLEDTTNTEIPVVLIFVVDRVEIITPLKA